MDHAKGKWKGSMKGILMAGGSGSRLYPITRVISKQMVPVYDKPMIYHPLSTLMLAGIRDILIISTPQHLPQFQELLGSGDQLGCAFNYAVQPSPDGLGQAFVIGRDFVGGENVAMALGDNIYYGDGLIERLQKGALIKSGATIFAYRVKNPKRYGVVDFNDNGEAIGLEEKPAEPKSDWAITGLYFYDNQVLDFALDLKPSARGELEVSDINNRYLAQAQLRVEKLGRGITWLDTGTHESLMQASNFIAAIEIRQGLKVACLEEVAYRMGYIDEEQLSMMAETMNQNGYSQYLLQTVLGK